MYKTKDEALEFIFSVNNKVPKRTSRIYYMCSGYFTKPQKRRKMRIAGQNMHYKDKGAFTGENSPLQIKTAGANYILIGHSERSYYNETDETVNLKMHAAFKHGLILLCVENN